ncbi:MAG: helix-turn-helix domain-containing protein [Lentisphaeria bacterium]|nr:helix-turn-helix domain-containing protein [Lentisphaeria bacterium]
MNSRDALKNAAAAFETQFCCRLCLHDYTGRLPGGILPRYHLNPYCTSLKAARPRLHGICFAFDRFAVREHWEKKLSFTVKQCPCGFLEAVFPVLCNGRIAGCLFAGPFAPGEPGSSVHPDLLLSPVKYEAPRNIRKANTPPGMPKDSGAFRAYGELLASQIALLANAESVSEPRSDRERILQFLEQHYERSIGLDDAAELLDLSPSRASDRVRRLFGKGFCALLRECRIDAARRLLAQSGFSAEDIARRCGFRDGAYFHRVFRHETGISPMEYRRRHQSENA